MERFASLSLRRIHVPRDSVQNMYLYKKKSNDMGRMSNTFRLGGVMFRHPAFSSLRPGTSSLARDVLRLWYGQMGKHTIVRLIKDRLQCLRRNNFSSKCPLSLSLFHKCMHINSLSNTVPSIAWSWAASIDCGVWCR